MEVSRLGSPCFYRALPFSRVGKKAPNPGALARISPGVDTTSLTPVVVVKFEKGYNEVESSSERAPHW